MLTDQERNLVRQLWARGPAVLTDVGYTGDAIKTFMARPDVRAALALLDEEFKHQRIIRARTRYVSERNLAKLADGAAAVLANALAGPEFLRHPTEGHILTDARGNPIVQTAETSTNQVRAAQGVLNALGLGDTKITVEHHGDFKLNVLVDASAEAPEIESDPIHTTEEERALSRERVRNVIDQVARQLPAIRDRVNARLLPPARTVKKKKTKKATKKKVVRMSLKKRVSGGKA